VNDHEIFVGEGTKKRFEWFPILLEKYVDGDRSIAFPPPRGGQFQEELFQIGVLYAAKIVNSGDPVIAILHYTDVLDACIYAQSNEWISVT
jgi:hypothetical protein